MFETGVLVAAILWALSGLWLIVSLLRIMLPRWRRSGARQAVVALAACVFSFIAIIWCNQFVYLDYGLTSRDGLEQARAERKAARRAEKAVAEAKAEAERQALQNQHTEAGSAAARARDQAQAWREAHKVQAWFHDKGIGHAPKLRELEQQREEHRAEWQRLGQRIEEASLRVQHVRQQAHQRITAEQEPTLAKLAELEALQKEKARQEREAEAKRLQQQRIEREREEESMAALEHRLAELRAAQEADATQPEPSDNDPRWAAFERTFMHAAQFEHYLSLTVLAAPLAGLKARFAAYMDTAAEQGMTPEMFAQACAKGMAEQERRAMQEQAARDADPKQPQEDSPVSTPTP